MRIGDLEVFPLADGEFRLDGGAMFGVVPKTLWEQRAPADSANRIRLGVRPVLVKAGGRNVLIDAGIGDKMPDKLTSIYGIDRRRHLGHALSAHGLTEADIDLVVATHLHFDHAGGFTAWRGGRLVPRFPRARYVVRRGEWEAATHSHARNRASYLPDDFLPLLDAGVIEFVDADEEILPGLIVERTGGHTEHHQIVRLSSGGRTAIFAADLVPTIAHVDGPWIMSYDLYPVDTLRAKERLLGDAVAGEYVIFFEHDPDVPAGVVRSDGRSLRVEPVDVA